MLGETNFFEETRGLFSDENLSIARSKVVQWINAISAEENTEKCNTLSKIQEILINTHVELLDEFMDNVLSLSKDPAQEVRRSVVNFIENICKVNINFLPRVVTVIAMLLRDSSPQVIKRVIQACAFIYKNALKFICSTTQISDEYEKAWNSLCLIKGEILDMIDSVNDGIRTNAVKFLEGIVILQTYVDEDSRERSKDFSLDDVPITLKIARRRKLEIEALNIFDTLLKFHAAVHISSVNLIACTGTLCTIAKSRTSLMKPVVEAMINLTSNLPPTLTNSQVNSVKKHLKMQLLSLLKNRGSIDIQQMILSLLQELGVSPQDIIRAVPKIEKSNQLRRIKRLGDGQRDQSHGKRLKLDSSSSIDVERKENEQDKKQSREILENTLSIHLKSLDKVVELVLVSINNLPNEMPSGFANAYKPILNMSIDQQVVRITNLLSNQIDSIDSIDVPRSISQMQSSDATLHSKKHQYSEEPVNLFIDEQDDGTKDIDDHRKEQATKKLRENIQKAKGEQILLQRMKQRAKTLKLQEITKVLNKQEKEKHMLGGISRILQAEWQCTKSGVSIKRRKVLTVLAATLTDNVRDLILKFIVQDLKNRLELAFSWLYEEYCLLQGFTRHSYIKTENKPDHAYNKLFSQLVSDIILKSDTKEKIILLRRVYLEAPFFPEESVSRLVELCELEDMSYHCLELIRDLTIRRPTRRHHLLNALLVFTMHENAVLREKSLDCVISLYVVYKILPTKIIDYAVEWLGHLEHEQPPHQIFSAAYGRPETIPTWNEHLGKICMSLVLALMPYEGDLIQHLSKVYVKAASDIKRAILRAIETPVKKMGCESTHILKLIEECPKGVETLVTRIVHTLTEKSLPTQELVTRVRYLYHNKVNDVRILIPILNGLPKSEILDSLPKFLKLNPVVVKEVFNRLFRFGIENANQTMSIVPADILLELHTIDTTNCELKYIVKAISICLAEKDIFTQDVLASCLQKLVESSPLPTLLMRTVIQTLSLYGNLASFVVKLLHKLIFKQVWKYKVIWDGFLKCCQRLKPQSYPVLMQLPLTQLQEAINQCPDLRESLLEYAENINESQSGYVCSQAIDVLAGRTQDVFVADESLGYIKIENIKKEKEDPILIPVSKIHQPLPPGEE